MGLLLEGKVAIVTGAGRGIGREHALALAREGAKVVVNDLGGGHDGIGKASDPAQEVVYQICRLGGEAIGNCESVADFNAARRMIGETLELFGRLDIVVNNAGILRDRMVFNMSEEDWDAVIAVHLKGTFNLCRHACVYWRELSKSGNPVAGRIINTSSDSGLLGTASQSNYGAAKAGIAAFTRIVAMEMRKYGVTSNAIVPVARTRMTTDATPATKPLVEAREDFDPKYISPLVVALASDGAAEITGQVIRIVGRHFWPMEGWRSPHTYTYMGEGPWDAEKLVSHLQMTKDAVSHGATLVEVLSEVGLV